MPLKFSDFGFSSTTNYYTIQEKALRQSRQSGLKDKKNKNDKLKTKINKIN
jgi:hypothetical protein